MNKEEYEEKKQSFENDKITRDLMQNAPLVEDISDDDITQMVEISNEIMTDEEKEKIINEEEEEKQETLKKFGGETLSKIPELSDFLRSEEHFRLGTNARIPIPLELNGNPIKVFIRPLSRKELIECRNRAESKGHGDVDYEAILMTCTDSNGKPYTEKDLSILGYGHMQTIAEAIIIASGESPDNTKTALRDRLVGEFLEKFTPKAIR